MKRSIVAMWAVCGALCGLNAWADHAPSVMLEQGVESSSDLLSLPSHQEGLLLVRECSECALRTLRLDANSRLYVGGTKVTLEKMSEYLRSADHKPVSISYRISDQIVSRVAASQ